MLRGSKIRSQVIQVPPGSRRESAKRAEVLFSLIDIQPEHTFCETLLG